MSKFFTMATGIVAALTLVGCATPLTTIQTAVGPNPHSAKQSSPQGNLEVFPAWVQAAIPEGMSPMALTVIPPFPSYEKAGYSIYDAKGRLVKNVGYNDYSEPSLTQRVIPLTPGAYRIETLASAGSGNWTVVPVVIEAGKTTRVHLNGRWEPPAHTPASELVYLAAGFPIGWRAGLAPGS